MKIKYCWQCGRPLYIKPIYLGFDCETGKKVYGLDYYCPLLFGFNAHYIGPI